MGDISRCKPSVCKATSAGVPAEVKYAGHTLKATPKRKRERDRIDDNRFYASGRWRRLRAAYLQASPLCARCEKDGRTVLAQHVHHVVPRHEDPRLELAWSNLESICPSCHNIIEPRTYRQQQSPSSPPSASS